ncbi:rna binding protein [Moniliophthora roreri]|nr:rna binding protein [Moniliophthora roreri]
MSIQSQQHLLPRSGSPTDNAPYSMAYQIQSQDTPFAQRPLPKGIYTMNGPHNTGHVPTDYTERLVDSSKSKFGGLNHSTTRSSFTAIPNATRTSRSTAGTTSALAAHNAALYRDNTNPTQSSFYQPTDPYSQPHLTSPTQSQMQPFDPRTGVAPAPGASGGNHHKAYNEPYSLPLGPGKPSQGHPPHLNGFIAANSRQNNYTTGLQLSSQTPYGPHIPTGINTVAGGTAGTASGGSGHTGVNGVAQEEISTIFVVGFPDDMQEREFQNMFTFSAGFEAATLKIPNKEYTSYGGGITGSVVGQPGVRSGSISGNYGYQGSNDPYNLVTVNQGGVVVDSGRDGTMASWPAAPLDDGGPGGSGHFFGGSGGAPRKQIIGFAKFRTREEALIARDMLQGRRVDIEKGSVLKAEMAKKNLHTKRGVGPVVPGGATSGGTSLGPAANGLAPNNLGFAGGVAQGLPTLQQPFGGGQDLYNELLNSRDREMSIMGLPTNLGSVSGRQISQWQPEHPNGVLREREDEDRRRGEILGAMGFAGSRGGLSDEEREPEVRQGPREPLRLRSGSAFDAFHSVPQGNQLQRGPPGITHPMDANVPHSHIANGFPNLNPAAEQQQRLFDVPGPWDCTRRESSQDSVLARQSSTPSPPTPSNVPFQNGALRKHSPSNETPPADVGTELTSGESEPSVHPQSDSCSSRHSQSSASSSGHIGGDTDDELSRAVGELAVSTENGNMSPQLPSPASGASSGSARNRMDQNPPINTLYVGNLPTSPPPMGYHSPDILEESLRELFRSRPGFRRLSFKQKNSGPMCFVEFEDVIAASKTMTELSGHTLNGLVKGQGIRLSYSRNPLGVRTPTSGTAPGPMLQQQQAQGGHYAVINPYAGQAQSPAAQNLHSYMVSPPPPRFSTSPAAPFASASTFPGVHSQLFVGNNNVNFSGYRLTSSIEASPPSMGSYSPFDIGTPGHSNIPDQNAADLRHFEQPLHIDHLIPRALSPPSHIEAARAA